MNRKLLLKLVLTFSLIIQTHEDSFAVEISDLVDNFTIANIDTNSCDLYIYPTICHDSLIITSMGDTIISPFKEYWLAFGDDVPLANWGHPCSYIFLSANKENYSIIHNKFPPRKWGEFILINTKNISIPQKTAIPRKITSFTSFWDNSPNNYAIIISGGLNKENNNIRYWHDCKKIYNILTDVYKYNKNHIYVLFADGEDPADDCKLSHNYYVNSSPDLDNDGLSDFYGPADFSSVDNLFSQLHNTLSKRDNLFIYTIDHGDTLNGGEAYMCLWNSGLYTASRFASRLADIEAGFKNIIMGQCYSGGFVEPILNYCENVVIATAVDPTHLSYGSYNNQYDIYVDCWSAAVSATNGGSTFLADTNHDGYVSPIEAANYAEAHDHLDHGSMFGFNNYSLAYESSLYGPFLKISGPDTLWCEDQFFIPSLPEDAVVRWTYDGENGEYLGGLYPLYIESNFDSVSVLRGYSIIPDSTVMMQQVSHIGQTRPFHGTKTITANITRNGITQTLTKSIYIPEDVTPVITVYGSSIWKVGNTRTFVATNCSEIGDDFLLWEIYVGGQKVREGRGRSISYNPVSASAVTVRLTNLLACQVEASVSKLYPVLPRNLISVEDNGETLLIYTDVGEDLEGEDEENEKMNHAPSYTLSIIESGNLNVLRTETASSPTLLFNKSNLSSGLYIINLSSNGENIDNTKFTIK